MKKKRENLRIGLIWFYLSVLCFWGLSGCKPTPPPKPLDEVRLQLKWIHQAQFAGFYVAQEKGHYAREGLKVTFLEGGPGVDNAGMVLTGKADFVVMSPEDLLLRRSQGAPLTALAAIYRRSAVIFAARADSGIIKPQDFKGKTVAAAGEGGSKEFHLQLRAMMKRLGIDPNQIKVIPYDSSYKSFYEGAAQITPCYATSGLIKIRQKGIKLNLIWPGDYGIHFYSDTLAATDKLISENPGLIARFLWASLKGWQDAVEDYQKAVIITMKYAQSQNPDLQTAMMEAMLPLVHTGEDHIGWMKPEVWQGMYDTLFQQEILEKPFDVNRAFTLRFLDEIYGGKIP
jgi:NitT/TauT family transport system substrate-binding protein